MKRDLREERKKEEDEMKVENKKKEENYIFFSLSLSLPNTIT